VRPTEEQFDCERRLLRHEINRLFNENEQLRRDLDEQYAEFFERIRTLTTVSPQSSMYLRHYFDIFAENGRLREEVRNLTV